jgi:hypothetical protein
MSHLLKCNSAQQNGLLCRITADSEPTRIWRLPSFGSQGRRASVLSWGPARRSGALALAAIAS